MKSSIITISIRIFVVNNTPLNTNQTTDVKNVQTVFKQKHKIWKVWKMWKSLNRKRCQEKFDTFSFYSIFLHFLTINDIYIFIRSKKPHHHDTKINSRKINKLKYKTVHNSCSSTLAQFCASLSGWRFRLLVWHYTGWPIKNEQFYLLKFYQYTYCEIIYKKIINT